MSTQEIYKIILLFSHFFILVLQNKLLFYEGELGLFDKNKKLELILSDVDKNLRDKIMNIFN